MKKLILYLFIVPFVSFGQTQRDFNNGFRELKLGADIRNYHFVERAIQYGRGKNTEYRFEHKVAGQILYTGNTFTGSESYYPDTELYIIEKGTQGYQNMPSGDEIEKIFLETFENKIIRVTIIVKAVELGNASLLRSYREKFGSPNSMDSFQSHNMFYDGLSKGQWYIDIWRGKDITLSISSADDSKFWRGTKRRFYRVSYEDDGALKDTLEKRRAMREKLEKQRMLDDF